MSAHAVENGTAESADVRIAVEAGRARRAPVVRALGAMSEVADQLPSFVGCGAIVAVGLATGRTRLTTAGAGMLASCVVAAALKGVVKGLVSRTRPHAVLDGDVYAFEVGGRDGRDEHSFPSGHTAGAVAAARSLARVYPRARGPAYATAAAIALVQLPRAKHYPADIAAGAAIGLVSDAIVAAVAPSVASLGAGPDRPVERETRR